MNLSSLAMLLFIVYCVAVVILLMVAVPPAACYVVRYILRLDVLSLKMYKFTHYKSFLLQMNMRNNIWGVEAFILSIPDIKFQVDIKTFRLIVHVKNL